MGLSMSRKYGSLRPSASSQMLRRIRRKWVEEWAGGGPLFKILVHGAGRRELLSRFTRIVVRSQLGGPPSHGHKVWRGEQTRRYGVKLVQIQDSQRDQAHVPVLVSWRAGTGPVPNYLSTAESVSF